MSGVHRTLRKTSITRQIVGDDAWDKAHFAGSAVVNKSDAKKTAKKEKVSAEEEAARMRQIQFDQMAALDDEENRRIKKILVSGRYGTRGYQGGPIFRQPPSARSAAPAAMSAGGGASGSPLSAALRAAGARGGRLGNFRAMVQG